MYFFIILSIILLLIIIIIAIVHHNNKKKNTSLQQLISEKLRTVEELDRQCAEYTNTARDLEKQCSESTHQLTVVKAQLEERLNNTKELIKQEEDKLTLYKNLKFETIESDLKGKYNSELLKYNDDLQKMIIINQEIAQCEFNEQLSSYEEQITSIKHQIDEYTAQLQDYQAKIEVYNKEILRRRAIEEQQDFYRIVLSEDQLNDIEILKSTRTKLHFYENLDKLIYDTYISKPVLEMIKRVLQNRSPSGIYKITRLKTGEIYIGKSTDVRTRWTQHAKTAFGVGTIAHSILHTTIEKDGIDKFTFELLEEVPKDKLGEREKYWINFYGSKEYGLNERAGG